jgi:hypothetical protein
MIGYSQNPYRQSIDIFLWNMVMKGLILLGAALGHQVGKWLYESFHE